MGRYSDYASVSGSYGSFSFSGGPRSGLGDVYELDLTGSGAKVGSVTLALRFGPQGRNFDSELSVAGGVEAELEGIGISLADVQFSGDLVSVSIGGDVFSYNRFEVGTLLVEEIVTRAGEDKRETAEKAAELIGIGMDAFDSVSDVLEVGSVTFAPRPTFTANFVIASGFFVEEEFAHVLTADEDVVVVLRAGFEGNVFEYYLREDPDGFPNASELEGYLNENPDVPLALALGEIFGYVEDGIGIEYEISGLKSAVQAAFDNSFDYGTNDNGIVDGTDAADVIDSSYVDPDGTSVSDGDDVIAGGMGNDLIDGGNGSDTVLLDGSSDEFVFSFGANLIVQDTNSSAGADEGTDTLIGIEAVEFSDGSRAEIDTTADSVSVSVFAPGGTQPSMRTVFDTGNLFSWSEYTDTFDLDGNRTSRDTTYNDGREAQNTYVAGVIASSIVTDVADEFVWNTVARTYDETGTQTGQTNTYDDGRLLETAYTDGVRSSAQMTDVDNAYAWASYTDTFDSNGDLALRVTTFDDGRVTEASSMGGVTTSSLVTDVDDAYAWDTIERGFDDTGMQISQTNTYDDDRVLDIEFVDGVRVTGTMTDVADVYAWSSYTDTYDVEGARTGRTTLYDDGREAVSNYENDVLASSFTSDIADQFVWDTVAKTYDGSGVISDQTTTYDNGRVLDILYTNGIKSTATMTDVEDVYAWDNYVDTYNDEGVLATRLMTFDDGSEVFTDYLA